MIALGARVWLGEPLTRRSLVALGVSLAGVAALSFGGPVETDAPNPLLGNVLELLAMLAAAGSMLTIKRLSSRYDPWLLTGWQSIAGVVFFLPFALLSDPTRWLIAPAMTWLSLGYLGIAVGLGASGLYNALAAWAASRAVQAINLVPAVALAAGWVWRGESQSPLQVAASLVIVARWSLRALRPCGLCGLHPHPDSVVHLGGASARSTGRWRAAALGRVSGQNLHAHALPTCRVARALRMTWARMRR